MGVRTIELPCLLGRYPAGTSGRDALATVSDCDNAVPYRLYIAPKYMIPQELPSLKGIADLCIGRCHLPDWVSPQKEHDALFPEAPQGLTDELVVVRVTPEVWAWSAFTWQAFEDRGTTSTLSPWQREAIKELLPAYCRKTYGEPELQDAMTRAETIIRAGGQVSDLLPQPDEAFIGFVEDGFWWGGMKPWNGFEKWKARRASAAAKPDTADVPDPGSSRAAMTSSTTRRARRDRVTTPELF